MNNSITTFFDTDKYLLKTLVSKLGTTPIYCEHSGDLGYGKKAQKTLWKVKTFTAIAGTCKTLNRISQACAIEIFGTSLKDRFLECCIIQYTANSHRSLLARNMDAVCPYESTIPTCKSFIRLQDSWDKYDRPYALGVTNRRSLFELAEISQEANETKEKFSKTFRLLDMLIQQDFSQFNGTEIEIDIIWSFCLQNFNTDVSFLLKFMKQFYDSQTDPENIARIKEYLQKEKDNIGVNPLINNPLLIKIFDNREKAFEGKVERTLEEIIPTPYPKSRIFFAIILLTAILYKLFV